MSTISPFPSSLNNRFKFRIVTSAVDEPVSLQFPDVDGIYNLTVDWGDGSGKNTVTQWYDQYNDLAPSYHVYSAPGTYDIVLLGVCTSLSFNNNHPITEVLNVVGDMGFTVLNFNSAQNLSSISPTMMNLKSLTTAESMFEACTGLLEIPAHIFDNSVNISTFKRCFAWNSLITAIPQDLFRYNTSATDFSEIFRECYALEIIPENLFKYNILTVTFYLGFWRCYYAILNGNIFYATGEQSTRFLNQSVDFDGCFNSVNSSSATVGVAPDLWNCNYGTGTPISSGCFFDCDALTISNYGDIPAGWK